MLVQERLYLAPVLVVIVLPCAILRLKGTTILCILRGTWVDVVSDLIEQATQQSKPPFVHLRYVQLDMPYVSGCSIITCLLLIIPVRCALV